MEKQVIHSFNTTLNIPVNPSEKQNPYLLNPSNKNRRKSIIPETHLPTIKDLPFDMDIEQESLPNEHLSLIDLGLPKQSNNKLQSSISSNENQDNNVASTNKPDINIDNDDDKEEFQFDSFILENFTRYSGVEDINVWLDETVKKFNRLFISNHSRYKAIPLLVEGIANKVYIKNQRKLQSFTDFQELLLLHFDNDDPRSIVYPSQSCTIQHTRQLLQNKSSNDKKSDTIMTLDNPHFSERPPKHHSTALQEPKTVTFADDTFNSQNTMTFTQPNSTINSRNLDDTSNVLRKAMIHNLMVNPMIFRGGKDDVLKWLEDLEHLFDVAHIPDANKLDLVSYTLRGEALQWYRNGKSTFTSWTTFVYELKKTFVSVYHDEIAFKKLESYAQTENQSICNFYTEVIKLCHDADPNMSETTKLKHLLNKTKPTIQFEVRRKKPTTAKEFLEYAKEVEELYQLTSFNTNIHFNNTPITSTTIFSPAPSSSTYNNPPQSQANTSHSPKWKKFDADNRLQHNNNYSRSSSSANPSNFSSQSQQPTYSSGSRPQSSQAHSNYSSNFDRSKSSLTHNRDHDKYSNNSPHSRISSRTNTPQHNINSLMYSNNHIPSVPDQQSLPTNYDTQDKQNGRQLQSSSNF